MSTRHHVHALLGTTYLANHPVLLARLRERLEDLPEADLAIEQVEATITRALMETLEAMREEARVVQRELEDLTLVRLLRATTTSWH